MALSPDDVGRIAHLARIAIDEAEAQAVLAQLNGIFGLIAEIQAKTTRTATPTRLILTPPGSAL